MPGVIDVITAAAGAAGVFAATNLDDIVVLTVLFVALRHTGRPRPWQIVAARNWKPARPRLAACSACCRSRSAYAR